MVNSVGETRELSTNLLTPLLLLSLYELELNSFLSLYKLELNRLAAKGFYNYSKY